MASREDDESSVESSLDELLAKKAADPKLEDDEDDVLDLDVDIPADDSSLDPLAVKAVPQQANEFTCRSCFLVKHRSQLANEKKLICTDCA